MVTETVAIRPKRKPRRGPPGVPCPSCHKLAGAEDEGEVQYYSVTASGETDTVNVSVDGNLMLKTACCSMDYKTYDLSGNEQDVTHECPKIAERDALDDEALAHTGTAPDEKYKPCVAEPPCGSSHSDYVNPLCVEGVRINTDSDDLEAQIANLGSSWTVNDEGDPQPYERAQRTARIRKTGKVVPIKRSRFVKTFRGFTTTVTVDHDLCGESVNVIFDEGDIEAPASSFDTV